MPSLPQTAPDYAAHEVGNWSRSLFQPGHLAEVALWEDELKEAPTLFREDGYERA